MTNWMHDPFVIGGSIFITFFLIIFFLAKR